MTAYPLPQMIVRFPLPRTARRAFAVIGLAAMTAFGGQTLPGQFGDLAIPSAEASGLQLCVVNVSLDDVLNVRSGPGTRYRVIHTLAPGSCTARATGECRGNWCRIATPGGMGWAHMRYLSADAGGDDGIGGGYTADLLGDGVYCPRIDPDDILNVREGPGVRFAIVGGFRYDYCSIRGTGRCNGNWCEVATHEFTGWVNTRYLRNVESH